MRIRIFFAVLCIFLIDLSQQVYAQSLTPTKAEFFQKVRSNADQPQNPTLLGPTKTVVGKVVHIPIYLLTPGQRQISVDNVLLKLRNKRKELGLEWSAGLGRWLLAFDGGNSLLSPDDPVIAVKGPDNLYVLEDGHHHLFMSLFVNAKTVPVLITEDWSDLPKEEFWQKLKATNRVFLSESSSELTAHPPKFQELADNPNRYLASLLAVKVKAKFTKGKIRVLNMKGNKTPIWMKINQGVPFVEFIIAEILTSAGLTYDPAWGTDIPKKFIREAKSAIFAAKKSGLYPQLNNVLLIDEKLGRDSDRAEELVAAFLKSTGLPCSILNGTFSAEIPL